MKSDDMVWVAKVAFSRPPLAMCHHEPGWQVDPQYGKLTRCLYGHDWVEVRRDVAETFTRPCQPCYRTAQRKVAA